MTSLLADKWAQGPPAASPSSAHSPEAVKPQAPTRGGGGPYHSRLTDAAPPPGCLLPTLARAQCVTSVPPDGAGPDSRRLGRTSVAHPTAPNPHCPLSAPSSQAATHLRPCLPKSTEPTAVAASLSNYQSSIVLLLQPTGGGEAEGCCFSCGDGYISATSCSTIAASPS